MTSVMDESGARTVAAGRAAAGRRGRLETGGVTPTHEGDFVLEGHLPLECGRTLLRPTLHYAVYGRLNAARDNAVLVCHALSGSALAGSWWPGLFGDGQRVSESAPLHGGSESAGSCQSAQGEGSCSPTHETVKLSHGWGTQAEESGATSDPTSQKRDVGHPAGLCEPTQGSEGEKQILRCAQDDKSEVNTHEATGIVDLETECVICVNMLGSCYGSTGPGSVNPEKENAAGLAEVYGPEFPLISIRDNVRAQAELLTSLGIARLKLAIGGSIGGMQALEWAILFPERVARAVVIAVAPLNAMGLALNHLQRRAILNDPEWLGGWYLPHRQPRRGLGLARQIAMLSYKSAALFGERFGRNPNRNGEDPWGLDRDGGGLSAAEGRFDVAGFLDYQGERFPERFDANAYLAILRTMDTWEPARGWRSAAEAYGRIQARVTFVGLSSDGLFPAEEVKRLAEEVRAAGADAEYREMATAHGHDAFLAEQAELIPLLR